MTLFGKLLDCLPIKRNERFAAQPPALIRDYTIRKVSPHSQAGHSGFNGWPVENHIAGVEQRLHCRGDVGGGKAIHPSQDPDKLAQARQRDGDGRRFA